MTDGNAAGRPKVVVAGGSSSVLVAPPGAGVVRAVESTGRSRPSRSSPVEPSRATFATAAATAIATTAAPTPTGVLHRRHPPLGITHPLPAAPRAVALGESDGSPRGAQAARSPFGGP